MEVNTNLEVRLTELKHVCAKIFVEDDIALIDKAFDLIKSIEVADSKRFMAKLNKSIDVAEMTVTLMSLDAYSLVSTLLFDFYNDDYLSSKTIKTVLGENVLFLLEGIKRLANISAKNVNLKDKTELRRDARQDNKEKLQQNENLIKLLLTLASDIRMIIIRLAFRLDLMRNIAKESEELQKSISEETSKIHAPIAHRLGLYNVKTELEELSMKYLHRDIYRAIAKKLNETKKKREEFINTFNAPIKAELSKMELDCEVKGRPKSIYSIWNKIRKQGVPFEEVYDLFAIRIILDNKYESVKEEKADCWKVYSMVTDLYPPNNKRLRDWISNPKNSGYESLHTTVMCKDRGWVEVQIRTRRMDDIAEKGHAAHWKYKEGAAGNENALDRWLAQTRETLENSFKSMDVIDPAKKELYSDEIFIFTPQRELKRITAGGTVLDFAFTIHSNVGSRCTGAKVNGKFQSLNYELKNGDEVEVITSKTQTPKLSWVDIVKSKRAKIKIKRLAQEAESKHLNRGKEIIQYKCEQLKIDFGDELLRRLMAQFAIPSFQELYERIGDGKIEPLVLKEALLNADDSGKKQDNKKPEVEEKEIELVEKKGPSKDYIVIDALGGIDFELAKCCSPVKGDPVFGFITVSKGTKIHNTSCSNANEMIRRFPYRIVEARWTDSIDNADFIADLRVEGQSNSLLNNVFNLLTVDMKLSIRNISVDENNGKKDNFACKVSIYVKDLQHLNGTIERLKSINGAEQVYRM